MRQYIYALERAVLEIVEEHLLSPQTEESLLSVLTVARPDEILMPLVSLRP